MTNQKKQQKITKLFRATAVSKPPEDKDELEEEIEQLERKLTEKQNELFQLQRCSYKHKQSPPKETKESFVRPKTLVVTTTLSSLKREMEHMLILTGIEVQSYVVDDHCCVVFHMQHDAEHEVKHGLKIDTKNGVNKVSASSLPLGFNLEAVLEQFDNIMKPDCLRAIRKALVAYYDRLDQFRKLKKLLNIEAELFKTLDASYIEVTYFVEGYGDDEEEQFNVVLMLDYRVYDIRPKAYSVKEIDLPEGAAEDIKEQCAIFKKKPLHEAFYDVFMDDMTQYKLVPQVGIKHVPDRRRKRPRTQRPHTNNDDTFHPEDCSDISDDDVEISLVN